MTAHGAQALVALGILLFPACAAQRPPSQAPVPAGAQVETLDPEAVKATLRRVADWQLANPVRFDPRNWAMAPSSTARCCAAWRSQHRRYRQAAPRAPDNAPGTALRSSP